MYETPRRNLRSGSVDSHIGPPQLKSKFPNTEKWNNILNTFLKDCPRGRHRRQFTYVEDSFTGKEAVDFMIDAIPKTLLNGREVTRASCTKLLQKFMEENHFYRHGAHEGKERLFKDNTWLYCFFATPPTTKSQTPKLIRRSSFTVSMQKKLQSLSPATKSPEFDEFTTSIPASPPLDEGFNRRRSMSCNNLLEISNFDPPRPYLPRKSREPVRMEPITPILERNRVSREEKEGLYGSLKSNIIERIRRRKESPSPVTIPPTEPKLIAKAQITTPCPLPVPAMASTTTPSLNEIDMWSIYKTCLLNRLKYFMGDKDDFISWPMKGYHIKWNCERIDRSGIVAPRSKSDMYSDYIMRLINYLMMFPFPHENVNAVKYEEFQETKVFNVLCSNLVKTPPLLSEDEAAAILHAMNYFEELSKESSPEKGATPATSKSKDSFYKTPVSMFNSSANGSTPSSVGSDLPAAIKFNESLDRIGYKLNKSGSFDTPNDCITPMIRPRAMTDSMSTVTVDEVRSLPGLILTPELEEQIEAQCSSSKLGPGVTTSRSISSRIGSGLSYATAMTHFSPFRQQMGPVEYGSLLATISLIFLTLSSARRWKLHTLLRLMKRISTDENLKLDSIRSNKDMILEKLTKAVLPCDTSISTKQATDIMRVLLCGDVIYSVEKFFQVDKVLLRDVKEMTKDIMKQRMTSTDLEELNDAPTPENNVVQFCEKATANSFIEQKNHTDEHLLPLLDSIINNENMKPADKGKKLRSFKEAHPEVYSKRFPLEEVQETEARRGFLRRVFSLR